MSFVVEVPSRNALDVGCGTGNLARQLAARGFDVTGIDPSREAIDRVKLKDKARYVTGEIDQIRGAFNLITCKHVYVFVDDKPVFLRRVASHLSDGGIFALVVPTLDQPGVQAKIAVDRTNLLNELASIFSVISECELPSGLLLLRKTNA